jgi:cyclopropane-fatty-acyl-phospholipid synthase
MAGRQSYRWERDLVRKLWDRVSRPPVRISLWDGAECGSHADEPVGHIQFRDPKTLQHFLWDASLAFGDGFRDGVIDIKGDLIEVLEAFLRGMALADSMPPKPSWRNRLIRRKGHSFDESKSSVHHHYDISNDFYRLWLDEQLVYTCAYYERPELNVAEAQVAKFDHVCRKLRIQPGDLVAEAGCGWGAFALHMARQYGARVRAYNLSKEQIAYARQRARDEGLDARVEFVQDDYRNIQGSYDVFVSIGMLEHVGVEQFRNLGATINRVLTENGRALLHSIGRNVARPLDTWIEQRIFPGAEPPSLRQMMDIFEPFGFSVLDVENLRLHYAQTCRHWLERFEAQVEEVARMFDEKFVRAWRYYLASSSAAFLTGHLQLFQVQFARALDNTVPWTRADIYRPSEVGATV